MPKHALSVISLSLIVLLSTLSACAADTDEANTITTPSPSPTAELQLPDFGGPMIGSVDFGSGVEDGACTLENGCVEDLSGIAVEAPEGPLPLSTQRLAERGVELGIPEGYSPLTLPDETLIAADSAETLGQYTFSVRRVTEAELNEQLARFDLSDLSSEGNPFDHPLYTAYWSATEDYGAIVWLQTAIINADDPRDIFIEGAASAAYWPGFRETFGAMVRSVTLATDE